MSILLAAAAALSSYTSIPQQVASVEATPSTKAVPVLFNLPLANGPLLQQPRRQDAPAPLSPRFSAPTAERGAISLPAVDWANGNAALKMKVVGVHLGWIF